MKIIVIYLRKRVCGLLSTLRCLSLREEIISLLLPRGETAPPKSRLWPEKYYIRSDKNYHREWMGKVKEVKDDYFELQPRIAIERWLANQKRERKCHRSPRGGGSNPTLAKQIKSLFDLEYSYIFSTARVHIRVPYINPFLYKCGNN